RLLVTGNWELETARSLPYKLPHIHQEVRAVNVPSRVDGNPLRQAGAAGIRIRTGIRDQVLDRPVLSAADPDSASNAQVIPVAGLRKPELSGVGAPVARFGVGHIQRVGPLVDVHAARPAELEPLRDELAVRLEDLDPVVLSIAHEEPPARV